ncbi:hypothetical protein E2I00_000016, partial [Balaenoptera physalus]
LRNTVVPWLVLLAALCTFLLGVFVWAVFEHFLATGVPSTLQHPAKFRFLHCVFLYMVTWGNLLEKLGICSMPRFIQFLHNSETDSVLLSVGKLLEEISLSTVWFCRAFTPVVDGQERVQGGMGISASFWQVCVVICGHSAGAGIVTLTSQTLVGRSGLPRIRAQVLIYPIVQLINFRLPSFPQNQYIQFLTRKFMMHV